MKKAKNSMLQNSKQVIKETQDFSDIRKTQISFKIISLFPFNTLAIDQKMGASFEEMDKIGNINFL